MNLYKFKIIIQAFSPATLAKVQLKDIPISKLTKISLGLVLSICRTVFFKYIAIKISHTSLSF